MKVVDLDVVFVLCHISLLCTLFKKPISISKARFNHHGLCKIRLNCLFLYTLGALISVVSSGFHILSC
jgi:hypothetical protein